MNWQTTDGDLMPPKDTKREPRTAVADHKPLDPKSLVGSYFHGSADRSWQGYVVAEPSPGIYLVQLFEWTSGSSTHQTLVRLEEMFEWRFYDDAEWMNYEYDRVVAYKWELAAKEPKTPPVPVLPY